MKFLAILRDSLREALDAKVIYFLFGLSALVIVGVGSLSFKPDPPEEGLKAIFARFPGAGEGMGRQSPLQLTMENFQQAADTTRGWEGEYSYDLIVTEKPQDGAGEPGAGEPAAGEGKGKRSRQKPGQVFRSIVLVTSVFGVPDSELSEEDRKLKAQIGEAVSEAIRSGGKMAPERMEKLGEGVIKELGPPRLERWVKRQLATNGSIDATRVSLEEEAAGRFRFRVECKASPDAVRSWPHSLGLFFGGMTLPISASVGTVVYAIESNLVAGVGAGLTMLLSTIITAFFIPNMLRKGTIDLFLAKPIHRTTLLVSKFIGGLTFMFINTVVIVVGIWAVLGLRSGLWGTGFLLSIFVLTFQFAIFYAFSVLLSVLTRSPVFSMLGSCALWAILFAVGLVVAILKPFHEMKATPDWAWATANGFRVALPRYKDLDKLNDQLIAGDLLAKESNERKAINTAVDEIGWSTSLAVTVGYIALFVGLACWRFNVKDY